MSGSGVAVLGSLNMDLVVRAPRQPGRGETLVGHDFEVFLGGKGCNQAIAAARSGTPTSMVGRLGSDDFGDRFLDCLAREHIDASMVRIDDEVGTGVASLLVEDGGSNSIVVVPRANHRVTIDDVDAAAPTIRRAAVLLMQLELPLDVVEAAARVANASGTTVVLNPAPAPVMGIARFAGLVDVLIPNEVECAALSGSAGDPAEAGEALREQLGGVVVVTVGDRGAWILDGGGAAHLPAYPVVAVDTVGAGDAFCGAFGARLAGGASIEAAARYANAAAALSVTRSGAEPSMPTAAQVEALLDGR